MTVQAKLNMNTYTYIDYDKDKEVIMSLVCDNISQADDKFEELEGIHPSKLSNVGCSIKEWTP